MAWIGGGWRRYAEQVNRCPAAPRRAVTAKHCMLRIKYESTNKRSDTSNREYLSHKTASSIIEYLGFGTENVPGIVDQSGGIMI